jgi:hypothetical protein
MAALSFVHDGQLKIDEATNPHPVCSGFEQGSADPQDANQKPPANEGKHATLKKSPFHSIIGCNDISNFFEEGSYSDQKGKNKDTVQERRGPPKGKFDCCIFSEHHALPPSKNTA